MSQSERGLFERLNDEAHILNRDYENVKRICTEFEQRLAEAESALKTERTINQELRTLLAENVEFLEICSQHLGKKLTAPQQEQKS